MPSLATTNRFQQIHQKSLQTFMALSDLGLGHVRDYHATKRVSTLNVVILGSAKLKAVFYARVDLPVVPARCVGAARRRPVERVAGAEPAGSGVLRAPGRRGKLSGRRTYSRGNPLPGSERGGPRAAGRVVAIERLSAGPGGGLRDPGVALFSVFPNGGHHEWPRAAVELADIYAEQFFSQAAARTLPGSGVDA